MKNMNKIEYLKKERASIIRSGSSKSLKKTPLEELVEAQKELQHVKVIKIEEETSDTKSFYLAPDNEKTFSLIPFKAGEYISLKLFIDNKYVTRAYSLSSSPSYLKEYRITIKRVAGGLVSNYMLDQVKVGDKLVISKPLGEFGYHQIKDEHNCLGICGGSGITPFMALAYAIENNLEDCKLTVFYSVKTKRDIIFKNEIEYLNKHSKKVKFMIILTREEDSNYLNGHITKDMIEPYIEEFNTVLMCGPKGLYKTMNEILYELHIPHKNVYFENYYLEYTPSSNEVYELKVILKNDLVLTNCRSNETILEAMENAGIKAPSLCRIGTCGYCKTKLLSGKIKVVGSGLKKCEVKYDYIHPCITYPLSDITLRLDI